jgi:hypothetical protein
MDQYCFSNKSCAAFIKGRSFILILGILLSLIPVRVVIPRHWYLPVSSTLFERTKSGHIPPTAVIAAVIVFISFEYFLSNVTFDKVLKEAKITKKIKPLALDFLFDANYKQQKNSHDVSSNIITKTY